MMKKRMFTGLAGCLFLVACASPAETPATLVSIPFSAPETATFDINTPVVFSTYDFPPTFPALSGKTLILEMTEGTYDAGQLLWQSAWSGQCQFRTIERDMSLPANEGVVSCPLPLYFNAPFSLQVDDYNGDGAPDFALTQFGSTSGGEYAALFTLAEDGTVSQLPVLGDPRSISAFGLIGPDGGGHGGVFLLPFYHYGGSCMLERTEYGFAVDYADVRGGFETVFLITEEELHGGDRPDSCTIRDLYRWNGSAFILYRQDILDGDGTLWKSGTSEP